MMTKIVAGTSENERVRDSSRVSSVQELTCQSCGVFARLRMVDFTIKVIMLSEV